MSAPEINDKLSTFLRDRNTIEEDFEVVYIFVELRKLLEQTRSECPFIWFIRNWIVHSKIDQNISECVRDILRSCIENGNAKPLLQKIRDELRALLTEPSTGFLDDCKADSFYYALQSVLNDQPIIVPACAQKLYLVKQQSGLTLALKVADE
jgi:hypothetical protein